MHARWWLTPNTVDQHGQGQGYLGVIVDITERKQAEEKLGFKPIAKILSSGAMGVEPNIMGVGPVEAIKLA